MMTDRKPGVTLFADRTSGQWVVRDVQGRFWVIPSGPNAWQQRQTFEPSEDTTLEVIPGHYKSLLGIPD